jgi:iron(III) transport system permease protein
MATIELARGQHLAPRAGAVSLWQRLRRVPLVPALAVALVAYLTVVPLALMLWFSVSSTGPGEAAGAFTLANYAEAYLNPANLPLLTNTLLFTVGSSAFGLVLGLGFAWLVERTNTPLRNFAYVVVPLTAATPGILFAIAWVLLLSPRIGVFNAIVRAVFGLELPPFDPYSLNWMIVVEGVRITPTVFLMLVGLLRGMDPALEEAAATSGAHPVNTFFRVTLPVLLPGIAGALIYVGTSLMGSFEIPAVLGMPVGVNVVSTRIWQATQRLPRDFGLAASLASGFGLIALLAIWQYQRVLRVQQQYVTVTGKGYRPRMVNLGRWRYVGSVAISVYFVLAILAPLLILGWASLLPFYQAPSMQALRSVTLSGYTRLFTQPWFGDAVRNTAIITLLVPTVTILLSAVSSWIIVRSRFAGRKLLDALAFLPHTMPGIILAVAILWLYLTVDVPPIYGTVWIILVALSTQYLAFGTRTTNGALYQLHQELEEAAALSGASWLSTFRRITIPLLLPSLVSGWIWIAIHAMRELSVALMLSSPDSRILPVLIWDFWQNGEIDLAAASGVLLTLLVAALMVIGRLATLWVARKRT